MKKHAKKVLPLALCLGLAVPAIRLSRRALRRRSDSPITPETI